MNSVISYWGHDENGISHAAAKIDEDDNGTLDSLVASWENSITPLCVTGFSVEHWSLKGMPGFGVICAECRANLTALIVET